MGFAGDKVIIWNEKQETEIQLGFLDILLDETLVVGTVYVPRYCLKKVSGLNHRLPGKKIYEFILRMACEFQVCLSGKRPDQVNSDEYLVLDSCKEPSDIAGLQTDCYILSRYKKILLEQDIFQAAADSILLSAGQLGVQWITGYLEDMLQEKEVYRYFFQGSQPFLIYTGADICYHLMDVFAQCLGSALQKKGYFVEYFDLSKEDHTEAFRYIGQSFQAVIGMQSYMFSVHLTNGQFLHDGIDGPKYNFVFDHPIWFRNHLAETPKDLTVLTLDFGHKAFIKQYFPVKVDFLPPGGMEMETDTGKDRQRIYDVVFIGSYVNNACDIAEHLKNSGRTKRFLINRFIRNMRKNPAVAAEHALLSALQYYDQNLSAAEFLELFHELRIYILYMSHYYRRRLIQVLMDAGIKVDVFGASWKFCPLTENPLFRWHDQDVSAAESLVVWKQSKIALNIMSGHKNAITERITNSMMQGAAVCTERNPYLEKQFRDGEDIIFYDLGGMDQLADRIRAYLKAPNELVMIGAKGCEKARQFHTWDHRAEEFLAMADRDAEKMYGGILKQNIDVRKHMSVKIFTMTHKKFQEPQESIYVPLHVGRAAAEYFGYQGDDTGQSISEQNKYYGELTGVYWVWKNVRDADIIGICHYRRFFLNGSGRLMNQDEYRDILKHYDIIVSNKVEIDHSYREYFAEAHNIQDLLTVGQVIREKTPDYAPYFEAALAGNTFYYGNLMVTSNQLFQAYAEWLFTILFEAEKRIDVSSYDLYHQRVFGFLSEQMLKIWIDKNRLKVYEGRVGITAEKAETVEFKLAMAQLIKKGEYQQARQMFYEYLKLRPDIRLNLSDLKGEIPIIEQLLYAVTEEERQNIIGLSGYSKNLDDWIRHFRTVLECISHFSRGEIAQEDSNYIIHQHVSWIMAKIILVNASPEAVPDALKAVQVLYEIYKKAGNKEACRALEPDLP